MSGIVHESAGATTKTLSVTGVTLALPYPSDMLYDFQLDHRVEMNPTGIGGNWYSKVGSRYLTGSDFVLGDSPSISLPPSLRFAWNGNPATADNSGLSPNFTVTDKRFTQALLFKINTGYSSSCIFAGMVHYGSWGGYMNRIGLTWDKSTGMLTLSIVHTYYSWLTTTHNMYIGQDTNWNTIVFSVDIIAGSARVWMNGVEILSNSCYTTWDNFPEDISQLDGVGIGGGSNKRFNGDIAAAIGWKSTVNMSNADLAMISEYLMAKYGLT